MADLSLQDVRSNTLEATYIRKLEERTAKRDAARVDVTLQAERAFGARQDGAAQATRNADTTRRLDAEQRRRDDQLAIDLARFDQDRLDAARRAATNRAAADLERAAQSRQDALLAEDARIAADQAANAPGTAIDTRPAETLTAEEQTGQYQFLDTLAQRAGQDPNRAAIVDVLA